MKLACTSGGLRVNSSSNWSTTSTASLNCPRHLETTASAVSESLNPSSRAMAAGSPAWSGASALRQRQRWCLARGEDHHPPAGRCPRRHPGPQQRALAHPRGSDHRQQPPGADLPPQRRRLGLATEEAVGVGLGEGGEARDTGCAPPQEMAAPRGPAVRPRRPWSPDEPPRSAGSRACGWSRCSGGSGRRHRRRCEARRSGW